VATPGSNGLSAKPKPHYIRTMHRTVAILCQSLLAVPLLGTALRGADPADCLRIPPMLEARVLYYQSFSTGLDQPEVNLAKATLRPPTASVTDQGLTGPGLAFAARPEKPATLTLLSPEFRPSRPLTVSFWWRLDAPMEPETCFHLCTVEGGGIVSNFVRGKGEWCGLREPTYIQQVYYFKGMKDSNQLGGRVWFEPGEWHHTVLVFRNADRVQVYWDGVLRTDYASRGRPFGPTEGGTLSLGPSWLFHPMTIDEILVLDRALDGDEIRTYATAVRQLREWTDD